MSRSSARPAPHQLDKERAILWAIILDTILMVYLGVTGLLSGSMTAFSEIVRFMLLLFIEYVSYIVLRRAHRSEFTDFEYGTGKIERVTNLLVAFGLLLSCIYILSKVFTLSDDAPMAVTALLLLTIGATINLMVNYYFSVAFIRSNKTESSVIIASQIAARIAKTVASAVVLFVLILTLWLPDPRAARMVDLAGSVLLVGYMAYTALGLIRESLPEILDRSIPEPEHLQIIRILTQHFDHYDGFGGYKTRRSGKDLFILLKLGFFPHRTIEEIESGTAPLRAALEAELPGSSVTIEPEIMPIPENETTSPG